MSTIKLNNTQFGNNDLLADQFTAKLNSNGTNTSTLDFYKGEETDPLYSKLLSLNKDGLELLKPRNIFDSSKYLYLKGDEVFVNGWYTCIKNTTLNTPITDTNYWVPKNSIFNYKKITMTTNGFYTPSDTAFLAKVTLVGGGGGSGSVTGDASLYKHANAGTCGYGTEFWLDFILLESARSSPISITVGTGGVGSTSLGSSGSNGGSTIFGSLAVAAGGVGGASNLTAPTSSQVLSVTQLGSNTSIYNGGASLFGRYLMPGLQRPPFINGNISTPSSSGVSVFGYETIGMSGNSNAHPSLPVEAYGLAGGGRIFYPNTFIGTTCNGQNGNKGVAIIEEYCR